jgi:long-subunit fatty acid transport protein
MAIKKLATATAIIAAGTSSAYAAGLDRSTFSSSILFQEGTYAEVAGAMTTPDVRSSLLPFDSVADNFNTIKLGFKTDLTDKIAVAVAYTNQPVGADINYKNIGIPLAGVVNGQRIDILGKYQFTKSFSAYGGVRYQYLNGSVDLTAALGPNLAMDGEGEYGYIAGIAYEIPDIKLRVALSYESSIDYTLNTRLFGTAISVGTTTASTPDAWTLEFQSGVAANTLVFGSIRYADWEAAQITVLGTQITSFLNEVRYDLGVAYRFNDKFVGFTSFGYEAPTETPQSAFGPTDGQFDMTFGGQASLGYGVKLAASLTYSRRGDTIAPFLGAAGTFNDSNVYTFGVKLSKNF